MMQLRNPSYNSSGGIDCEIEHPRFGWIPYTARSDDPEPHGAEIYAAALAMGPAAYVPAPEPEPGPAPVPQSISSFQAIVALLDAGLLADVEIAIADADPITQLAWSRATEWRRDSPAIAAIGAALGLSPEDIDNLFIEAAKIIA